MEEQKSKILQMNAGNNAENQDNKQEKYTYEQLEGVCDQQQKYIINLTRQLQQANNVALFKRLEFLFKVVELSNQSAKFSFSNDFVDKCIAEIEEAITIPSEEKEETKEG